MRTLFFLALLGLFTVSCGSDAANTAADTDETSTDTMPAEEEQAGTITLSPMSASPGFEDAKMTSMDYKDGKMEFGVEGDSYQLGAQTPDAENKGCANSAKGQHIHLIVDKEPYAAKYEASFDYEIADGMHYILAFLSRSYHESLKHADAAKVMQVAVQDNSIGKGKPVTEPMIFYSRPKGSYIGKDTENVMLDFYVANATLGDGYQVRVQVGEQEFYVDSWQPYILNGLPMGENTVTLTLMDKDRNAIDTPLNPVSRTFTLAADPAE